MLSTADHSSIQAAADDALLKLLLLSPHRDDAAFSLSLSLLYWLQRGHDITLLNVFTQSLYAPCEAASRTRLDDPLAYVSAMRQSEDVEFLAALGGKVSLIDLELEDAPLRLQCDVSGVCDVPINPADEAIPRIRQAVSEWIEVEARAAECGLVVPLALGHHVDHCVVRDAALPLTANVPSAFYEDLPYAMRPGVQEDLLHFRSEIKSSRNEKLFPALCGAPNKNSTRIKGQLISSYKSQVDREQVDAIGHFSDRYDGAERMWVNRAWHEIAEREGISRNCGSFETAFPA